MAITSLDSQMDLHSGAVPVSVHDNDNANDYDDNANDYDDNDDDNEDRLG